MPKIKLYSGKKPKLRPALLLHPNIPKPLHTMAPRTIKGKEWWDKKRQAAYEKANYYCMACGVHKTEAKYHNWLEAHECYEIDYKKGTATFIEVVALCHSCHAYIHLGRLSMLLAGNKISEKMAKDIIRHGDRLIKKNKLKHPPEPTVIADWADWLMIIGKKKYKGKFNSQDEWEEYFIDGD